MPHVISASFTIDEDDSYLFTPSIFSDLYSDPDGDELSSIRIAPVPFCGTLLLGNVPLSAGYPVSLADIAAGLLRFVPPANTYGAGIDSFDFIAVDMTGEESSLPSTFSFDVMAVNDAPTFLLGDGMVMTPVPAGSSENMVRSVRAQADGSIVVAGSVVGSDGVSRFALVQYNDDGSIDKGFGNEGWLTTGIGLVSDYASSMAVQKDGKILVAGYMVRSATDSDFAVVRYESDGNLDMTFSSDGKVTNSMGSRSDFASSIVVQPDGKIVVAGYTVTSDDGTDSDFAVVRYNSDGVLDKSFSSDGKTTTSLGTMVAEAYGIALQSDGKILVAGYATQSATDTDFALVRYDAGGTLDKSFSGDGKVTTAVGDLQDVARSVAVQSDGKIVVAGYSLVSESDSDFALVRFNENGTLDTSFNGDGMAITPVGASNDRAYGVALQGDGKILVAGYAWNGSDWDIALVRYNSDGTLDTTFGGDGMVITPAGTLNPDSLDMVVQPDGRIVVAATVRNGSESDAMLVRYNPDGTPDRSFDPLDTLGGTVLYIAGSSGTPVVLDADVQVFDAESEASGSYNGAALSLFRQGGANPEDQFVATGSLETLTEGAELTIDGTAIGMVTTNSGGLLQLDFGAAATSELVNRVMQSIAYANVSDAPPDELVIGWHFSDGDAVNPGIAAGSTTVMLNAPEEGCDCTLHVVCWSGGQGLEGVTAIMTENATSYETTGESQGNGQYGFDQLTEGAYTLTASKAVDFGDIDAITVDDALEALGLAVGNSGADSSPYQYLAADVDRDGKVGFRDTLGILKMAFGREDAPEPEWAIVPESTGSEPMDNDNVNWPEENIAVTLDQDTQIDLVGVLLGDVDGSWEVTCDE